MTAHSGRGIWMRVIALIAVAFGLLTIREGCDVLFFDGAARAAAGSYVPFLLWFNFLAGFAYVIAGAGRVADAVDGQHGQVRQPGRL